MFFQSFHTEFPKIAENETRTLTAFEKNGDLPQGEYGFIDLYCNDKKCDCRRVMINVISTIQKPGSPPLAVISFGWEPKSFYKKWSPLMSDEMLADFKGPALDVGQPQSRYSEAVLAAFRLMLLDVNYRNRLVRHYVQFKQKTGMKLPKELQGWLGSMNDCGCGSGQKFRFCCGGK